MQKLVARVARAERQAERRKAARTDKATWKKSKEARHQIIQMRRTFTAEIRKAKEHRKLDWELGPLAPARHLLPDAGVVDRYTITNVHATHMQYGAGKGQYTIPNLPERYRRTLHDPVRLKIEGWKPLPVDINERKIQYAEFMASEGWKQVPKPWREESKVFRENTPGSYWLRPDFCKLGNHFCEGDTVAITKGPDVGKIGKIERVTDDGQGAKVKGVHQVELRMPDWLADINQVRNPFMAANRPVHIKHMKLLVKDELGLDKPVILDNMYLTRTWQPERSKYTPVTRTIPNMGVEIPMPEEEYAMGEKGKVTKREEEDDRAEFAEAYESDTLRITAEEETFQWSLRFLPMPEGIIDELRNPYSKFRTRHSPEYIAAQEAKDAAAQAKAQSVDKMKTPVQELNEKLRLLRQREWKKREDDNSIEKIGEAIAELQIKRQNVKPNAVLQPRAIPPELTPEAQAPADVRI